MIREEGEEEEKGWTFLCTSLKNNMPLVKAWILQSR
jgi:hypothetical protein